MLDIWMCECLLCSEVLRKGNEVLDRLRSEFMLSSDMFSSEFSKVWDVFNKLDLEGEKINLATVMAYNPGNDDFLEELYTSGGLITDIDSLARTIYKKHLLQQKKELQNSLLEKLENRESTFELYNEIIKINELLDDRQVKEEYSIQAGLSRLQHFMESDKPEIEYQTGFNFKFLPGDLVIIGARPNMGKSAFALSLLSNLKEPCLFYSLEMPERPVLSRYIAIKTGTPIYKIHKDFYNDELAETIWEPLHDPKPIEFNFNPQATFETIISDFHKHRRDGKDIKHIFIDHLGWLVKDNMINRNVELDRITRDLKALALKEDIVIIAMSQLSRLNTQRAEKKPVLSDLRESGAIEQNADSVLFIHRDEYYDRENPLIRGAADLIIAKNRHGELSDKKMYFDRKTTKFTLLGE